MPKCPNCSYLLVLLEHRRKYKCAKCGRLFPQQEVDSNEFRELNKRERKKDKKEAMKEYKREWMIKNRERMRIYFKEYYKKNKQRILAQMKEDREGRKIKT